MAKTKPQDRTKKSRKHGKKPLQNSPAKKPKATPESLLAEAAAFLQTSQPEDALKSAHRALALLQPTSEPTIASLSALILLGEIHIELGDADAARECFGTAASLDPDGELPEKAGGGSEKFLWLAQLCEEGGAESVKWFSKGAAVLRREISELEGKGSRPDVQSELEEKRRKLANVLCGVAEVYMTDLSWEGDAEVRCEALVTEALLVAPECAEALQTLASVRISQLKHEDARAALARSLDLWKSLDPEDPRVPDFPTRISLSRLLMEAGMEDEAIEVLERLVAEDDSSVEAWYLGGWCLHLIAEKRGSKDNASMLGDPDSEEANAARGLLRGSRDWLRTCLRLYRILEYEDEKLHDHAQELVSALDGILGTAREAGESEEDDAWEDVEGSGGEECSEDEEMKGT